MGDWQRTPWWLFWRPRYRRWIEREPIAGVGGIFDDSGWEYSDTCPMDHKMYSDGHTARAEQKE